MLAPVSFLRTILENFDLLGMLQCDCSNKAPVENTIDLLKPLSKTSKISYREAFGKNITNLLNNYIFIIFKLILILFSYSILYLFIVNLSLYNVEKVKKCEYFNTKLSNESHIGGSYIFFFIPLPNSYFLLYK